MPPSPTTSALALALVLTSCGGGAAIRGEHVLGGEGASGLLRGSSPLGCGDAAVELGLWGERWGTAGVVQAEVATDPAGVAWVAFPLETGVGTASAELRIEGAEARLPLGGRPGENEVVLAFEEGRLEEEADLAAASARALEEERAAWARGGFAIVDDGQNQRVVGDLQFRGEQPPVIAVHDETWLSPGPVVASRYDEGGDVVLTFAVEPSLRGEEGLVRVNVPTRGVVVPTDRAPSPDDRHLRLVPVVSPADGREERVARAQADALALEAAWIAETVPRLARAAQKPDGTCRPLQDLDPAWGLVFAGYDVELFPEEGECVAIVEPTVPQHRRAWRGRVGRGSPGLPGQ